jgi:hypothetical protein
MERWAVASHLRPTTALIELPGWVAYLMLVPVITYRDCMQTMPRPVSTTK